jgi:hypothetical protein
MPEERQQRNVRDARGERSWTRGARGAVQNPDNRNLPVQTPQARDASSRQLAPQRQNARTAQQPTRDREDQQTKQNRLAGLPREREAVAVDQLPQAVRDQMTRGAESGRTPTGRHRQAERNQLARQYRASDVSNLDNRLAHLQVRTGSDAPDRSATAQTERSALAAKVRAAREQMRGERSGPASARDMSRDGRAHTRNGHGPRDSRGPGNRADGRDRGDRAKSSPSLGRG